MESKIHGNFVGSSQTAQNKSSSQGSWGGSKVATLLDSRGFAAVEAAAGIAAIMGVLLSFFIARDKIEAKKIELVKKAKQEWEALDERYENETVL